MKAAQGKKASFLGLQISGYDKPVENVITENIVHWEQLDDERQCL